MAITPEYREYLAELFAAAGPVAIRRVFRFDGLYIGEVMFGLVADERVYLKTDEEGRKLFERDGGKALQLRARGRTNVSSYWSIPERLYDEPEELAGWVGRAFAIADNSPTTKRKRARAGRQNAHPAPRVKRRRSG